MNATNPFPALSLDDLTTAWLPRNRTQLAAMPGLNNDIGSIQVEADIAAIKHPIFPPYSGGDEITWLTLLNGRQLAQQVSQVDIRWRAFEIERRCEAKGWRMESQTSLLPDEPGVIVEVTITNTLPQPQPLVLGFLCSGRAMNTGNAGYSWSVPSIPTSVFRFTETKDLGQTVTEPGLPDAVCLTNEAGNAHAVHAVWPAPARWERERVPTWEAVLNPNESFTITLFASFHADKEQAISIANRWHRRNEAIFSEARSRWENLWNAAFTPRNSVFSGHLPVLKSPHTAMMKLYYNGILTLLTCRRRYEHAITSPCYLTLWPRRGEGSGYLAWELNCTSGILARLDPAALRSHWMILASGPWLEYQTTSFFTGKHTGWACCAQPQSIYTAAFNLLRWTGDRSWMEERILHQSNPPSESDSPTMEELNLRQSMPPAESTSVTGEEVLTQALTVHRDHHLPGKATIDLGSRAAYLECITTYAHGTAGHTALQAWALRQSSKIFGYDHAKEIQELENAARELYRPGDGYFDCEYPDGTRHPAANLYDIGLVLRHLGDGLSRETVEEIVQFARKDLLTPTWAHCLWPTDLDALSGVRCDHQSAGCFPGWPPQFVLGLLECGENGDWIADWLEGVSRVVDQGPFGQAYWAEDFHPLEAGAAAKCYDELTQGNHWVIGSGALFAEMILDGICGLQADFSGNLTVRSGLPAWAKTASLENISIRGNTFDLRDGVLIPVGA